MTCKDCIHFLDCSNNETTRYYGREIACGDVEKRCENFRDETERGGVMASIKIISSFDNIYNCRCSNCGHRFACCEAELEICNFCSCCGLPMRKE